MSAIKSNLEMLFGEGNANSIIEQSRRGPYLSDFVSCIEISNAKDYSDAISHYMIEMSKRIDQLQATIISQANMQIKPKPYVLPNNEDY